MSAITTHVLDAVLGRPAAGMQVRLHRLESDDWVQIGDGVTDADGRCRDLCDHAAQGTYRLIFSSGGYFEMQRRPSVYPEIVITFLVDGLSKYHIPLLLSDNSYTTYRGS